MGIGQVGGSEQVCRHWSSRTVWPQLPPAYVLRYISVFRGPEFAHPMDMFFGLLTNDNIYRRRVLTKCYLTATLRHGAGMMSALCGSE